MTAELARPKTVLVLDDETTVCRSVEKVLTRSGYNVVAASSVNAAVAMLDDGRQVDLVLADLMMPDVPGMEFIRLAAERWPRLPIVVITGYASVVSAIEATKLGAVDYLAKPFTPDELETTVGRAMARGPWKPVGPHPVARKQQTSESTAIDVDMPFDAKEVERATSPEFVARLTRSDVPILDFCSLGQRSCKRMATKGMCQKPECPIVAAQRKRGGKTATVVIADDVIDVDLPFSAREVASITGDAYVRALGRGDVPIVGRWPHEQRTRRRVLAVDDEPVVVQAIRKSLGRHAYRVDEAFSGHAALAQVARQPYDLVLLDMRMPDLNGLDMLPKIRECQPKLPVVIVTGYASIDTAVEAIQRGAADYVPKPFTPEELRATAERVLQLQRAA